MKSVALICVSIFMSGCAVIGKSNVATAPYTLLEINESKKIEVRFYAPMILVSTNMSQGSGYSAFGKLFKYIGGENQGATKISMTAPVLMDNKESDTKGTAIAMTAPVFMNESADASIMSFVMPNDFTLANTPVPSNPEIWVREQRDYKVAAIQFNGTLSDSNVEKHTKILTAWLAENNYTTISSPVKAGYNGPLTLPMLRKNEVLIEVK